MTRKELKEEIAKRMKEGDPMSSYQIMTKIAGDDFEMMDLLQYLNMTIKEEMNKALEDHLRAYRFFTK